MSARGEVMAFVERNVGDGDFPVDHKGYLIEDPAKHVSELLDALLNEHAHELAEKIRNRLCPCPPGGCSCAVAASFIDPEVNDA